MAESSDMYTEDYWKAQAMQRLEQDARVERMQRMSRTDTGEVKELTADERKIACDNINRYINKYRLTRHRFARKAGISSSALSELLAGRYKGDVDAMIARCEATISELLRREDAPEGVGFVKTGVAKRIFAIVKATSKLRGIGAFYCVSGVGKTMALEACIRLDFPSAIFIQANPGCASPLNFCKAILRQISSGRSVAEAVRSRADGFNAIVNRLQGSGRLIIVDEADCLSIDTLGLIRHLHDATGDDESRCPIVLCGRPNLIKKIDATTRCADIGGSLRGRLCVEHNLMAGVGDQPGGRWLFSVDEVTQILARFKVRFTGDAARWLTMLANLSAVDGGRECGGLRYAIKIFTMAITMHQGAEITADHLKAANRITRDEEYAGYIAAQIEAAGKRRAAATA